MADAPIARTRLAALDLLRGLAVAGMLIADNPGDWAHVYTQANHAPWHGWTVIDLVFPTFLFSVGMALGLSFPRVMSGAAGRLYWTRVARRTLALIGLGLLIEATYNLGIALGAGWPGTASLAGMRFPGILQRIGLCYALTALAIAATGRRVGDGRTEVNGRALATIAVLVLVGYSLLQLVVPVPGYGAGRFDPEGNIAAWLDRAIFTVPHIWLWGTAVPGGPPVYDPEGLLSTLPATVDTLAGVLVALAWRRRGAHILPWIAGAAVLLVAIGLALDPVLPINKRIFTASFALLSSGMAIAAFATLAAIWRPSLARWFMPLQILGSNAVLAFVVNQLLGRVMTAPLLADRETPLHALYRGMLGVFPTPELASLSCAVLALVAITLALAPLHARAIHFRL